MDRDKIKQALLKAYEAGWRGSLELKEEYAKEAVLDLLGPEEKDIGKLRSIEATKVNVYSEWLPGDTLSNQWGVTLASDASDVGVTFASDGSGDGSSRVPEIPEVVRWEDDF